LGAPASTQLATLAEEGNVAPLTAMLSAMSDVREVVNSGGLLAPGHSVTQMVKTGGFGAGGAPAGGEEGYVHIHAGIHGVGDLEPGMRDWRNPVARITIRRVK
jgi:hypothetical protein